MNCLVVGQGSIGIRHRDLLAGMRGVTSVHAVTRRTDVPGVTFPSLAAVPDLRAYDYFVIANETGLHEDTLREIDALVSDKTILVEKPLFTAVPRDWAPLNRVFVGYNMRLHPAILSIKKSVAGEHVTHLTAVCGQFLPEWRPGTDFRRSYSASPDRGGGVHWDLSHELDYAAWIAGGLELIFGEAAKVSNLDIDSADFAVIYGSAPGGGRVLIALDYLSKVPLRQLVVHTESTTYVADLVAGALLTKPRNGRLHRAAFRTARNTTYERMHAEILAGRQETVCSYEEGLATVRSLQRIATTPSAH